MAKFKITKGTKQRNIPVYAWNTGTGSPYGSLAYNTLSFSGEYRREYQTTWQNIPLVAGSVGVYTSGGFIVDGALVGRYQFGPPDEVYATGQDRWAQLALYGATNLLPIMCEIELDEVDYQNKRDFGVTNISGAPQITGPIHVAVTGYAANMDPGSYVLQTPSWKLKTDPVGGAVISGRPYVSLYPVDVNGSLTVMVTGYNTATNPSNLILVNPSNKIDTNTLGQVVMSGTVAVSTGSLVGLQVTVSGYTPGNSPASLILVNPSNKIDTNTLGQVVMSGSVNVSTGSLVGLQVTVSGYTPGNSPSTLLLVNPSNKIDTNSLGQVVPSGGAISASVTGQLNVLVTGYTTSASPANFILINPGNKIDTNSLGQVVPSGGAISATITGQLNVLVTGYTSAANPSNYILNNPANKIDTNNLGQVVVSGGTLNVTVTGYASTANPNTLILVNPANKLLTNVNGYVVPSGKPYVSLLTTDISGPISATISGYDVGKDPATLVLANTGYKLVTSSSGAVNMNFDQAVPYTNTAQSVGDSLNAARANGFGRWVLNTGSSPPTLTLYGGNSTTVVRVFNLDSVEDPTLRT